ncbi:MAG TPA: ABC transporter permease [Kofleriaceae bacterium]|nr:ABC transporter permease [Kofleriaceae bacterium]
MAFLSAVLRITVPYALAALGGTWSERAGVVNLALEGMLLTGAFAATLVAWATGSALAGVAAGAGAGLVVAALYALVVLRFRGDQIVCGVAVNLLADGLTRFLLKAIFDSSSNSPRVDAFGAGGVGLWATLTHPLVLATLLLVALSQWAMNRTAFGLRVRAVGEHPEAAASLGVRPLRVRLYAVLLGGAMAGLGGAWLAADQHQFVAGMSNGRGYIALAALIFGKWRPAWAALAALGFGLAEAGQITLQASGIGIPGWAVQMLPYVLTVVALSGFIGRSTPPRALGKSSEA